MKETALHFLACTLVVALLSAVAIESAFAQSQALNGQIEGTVLDQNKAAVPDARHHGNEH